MLGGGGQQVLGAKDVVLDGLGGADLHQRHMLMRRRVKDHRGVVGFKHLVQPLFVPDGAHQHGHGDVPAILLLELHLELVGTVLIDIKDEQLARVEFHHLAAELTADGTAAARDQHGLAREVAGNFGGVQRDLLAGEEVRRVQLTEARRHRIAVLVNSLRVTDHPHAAVGGVAEVDDLGEAVTF